MYRILAYLLAVAASVANAASEENNLSRSSVSGHVSNGSASDYLDGSDVVMARFLVQGMTMPKSVAEDLAAVAARQKRIREILNGIQNETQRNLATKHFDANFAREAENGLMQFQQVWTSTTRTLPATETSTETATATTTTQTSTETATQTTTETTTQTATETATETSTETDTQTTTATATLTATVTSTTETATGTATLTSTQTATATITETTTIATTIATTVPTTIATTAASTEPATETTGRPQAPWLTEEALADAAKSDSIGPDAGLLTVPNTTEAPAYCMEDGVSWEPLDMHGNVPTMEDDEWTCQRRCLQAHGCYHFSYHKTTGVCHLQDAFALRSVSMTEASFVSGPFQCWSELANKQSYAKMSDVSYLPAGLRCMEVGTSWQPSLGLAQIMSPNEDAMGMIMHCQTMCRNNPGCAYFTLHLVTRTCQLADATASPVTGILETIAGPPRCDEHIFVQRSILDQFAEFRPHGKFFVATMCATGFSSLFVASAIWLWSCRAQTRSRASAAPVSQSLARDLVGAEMEFLL